MHGLIFKTKESHRQDQSESFVFSFSSTNNKSNEITSLWPVFYFISLYDTFVVSSRRNKTNPYLLRTIPVLLTTLLLAFKPKLVTYDQFYWKFDQHVYYVCLSWNIFNRIHFFAICDVILSYDCSCRWSYEKLSKQLRSIFLFHHLQFTSQL